MTEPEVRPTRSRRSPADKFAARRDQLTASALETLVERGYANTSLRDIADRSPFSHGVLHYYFDDKLELIIACLGYFEERVSQGAQQIDEGATKQPGAATSGEALARSFAARMRRSLADEADVHRLWYEMRSQGMFEPRLREPVARVDAARRDGTFGIVSRYAELVGGWVNADPETVYAVIDGLFEAGLRRHLSEVPEALDWFEEQFRLMLPRLVTRDDISGDARAES